MSEQEQPVEEGLDELEAELKVLEEEEEVAIQAAVDADVEEEAGEPPMPSDEDPDVPSSSNTMYSPGVEDAMKGRGRG